MQVVKAFREAYGKDPQTVWHAPGRVNLIGEHTDYNDGLVLPFAVGWGVNAALSPRDDATVRLLSLQVPGELIDKLLEARPALGTCGLLMRLRYDRRDREVMTNEERHRFDQDRLIALEPIGLLRELL